MKEFWLLGQPYWVGVLVGAFIAFGATFGGVLTSFYLENRRRRREERNTFGRLIESVLMESSLNQAQLSLITHSVTEGKIVPIDIEMYALQIALTSPLTYRYAPYSLIKVMLINSTRLSEFKNILAMQRTGGSLGKGLTGDWVETLKVKAGQCEKLLSEVLIPEIELLRPQLRTQLRIDNRSQLVDKKMKAILQNTQV